MDLHQLISRYSELIDRSEYEELYKWKVFKTFQENWDIAADDFLKMFKKSFSKETCNLWSSNHYYPRSMMQQFIEKDAEKVREMFEVLFDESKELDSRLIFFRKGCNKFIETFPKKTRNHYHHKRALSTYLALRYPEKYFLYKFKMYKKFCEMTGVKEKPKKSSRGDMSLLHEYFNLCREIKEQIIQESDLVSKHKERLTDDCYQDPALNLLTQDFIYSATNYDFMKINTPKKEYNPFLNTILYGPPGTGKTYKTVNHALAIIEQNPNYLDPSKEFNRSDLREKFEEYRKKRQIRFVTFHPSFSYEDFVEGIRPELVSTDEDATETINYKIENGIFKEICNSASESMKLKAETGATSPVIADDHLNRDRFFKVSLGNSTRPEDDIIYEYCIENDLISIGYLSMLDCTNAESVEDIRELADQADQDIDPDDFGFDALKRLKFWMEPGDVVFVSKGTTTLRAIGVVKDKSGEGYFYDEDTPIRYPHFRHVEWLYTDLNIPVSDIYEKQFSQQGIYQMHGRLINKKYFQSDEPVKSEADKRYVLIIDEINRGNIPSIFGELITLIEPDKRTPGDESISVTLPYSKENDRFSVPSNLYLLGTMNTADRSVEALDIALRRRFEFIQFESKPELIDQPDDFEVNLARMLSTINERIEYLLDSDYCIGHSYFMGLVDADNPGQGLKNIFARKVIPLLEEYFYGHPEKIGLVLGRDFVYPKNGSPSGSVSFASNFNHDVNIPDDKIVYEVADPTSFDDLEPFISIYQND